jgi:serine phosphatase RsbU (regulator of sigma subunit)
MTVVGESADRFAADVSLALAGTLNLRRTLGRVVTLAVPALGDWCAVVIADGQMQREVSYGVGQRAPLVRHIECAPAPVPEPGMEVVTHPLEAHGCTDGVLIVLRPRDETRTARDAMTHELARRAALAIAAARIYEERAALASTLRAALLPPDLPDVPGVELGARYRAAQEATEIGGDFYQVYSCGVAGWAFEIGDVCGKGVNAAVLTGQVRQSLRTAARVENDPARMLEVLNDTMIAVDGSKFVTVVHGRLHRDDDGAVTIDLAVGGHPPPLVLRTDGTVDSVDAHGMIVGMLRDARFRATRVRLAPTETLLLYTDGVTEARAGEELLGSVRLASMLRDCRGMSAQAITERLEQLVLDYLDGGPHDDIALLALRAEATQG